MKIRTCLIALLLLAFVAPTLAGPKRKKPTKRRVFSALAQTKTPPMALPHSSPFKAKGKVSIQIKLAYVHARPKAFTDPQLRNEIPRMRLLSGFNAHQLLKTLRKTTRYNKVIQLRISNHYLINLRPRGFNPVTRKLLWHVTFLYRKKATRGKPSRFASYATMHMRIKSGRKVAFVGPRYRNGRTLIILYVRHL